MIATDVLSAGWQELRTRVRPRWQSLSKADVEAIDGNVDVLVDVLQERYGYTQQVAQHEVDRFLQEYAPM